MAHTTAERLRRAAGIRNPDTKLYKTGAPLATLQHILTRCAGLLEKGKRGRQENARFVDRGRRP